MGFVVAESRGALGALFTDFSSRHIAEDADALVEFRVLAKQTHVSLGSDGLATLTVHEPYLDAAVGPGDSVLLRCSTSIDALGAAYVSGNASSPHMSHSVVCVVECVRSSVSIHLRLPVSPTCTEHERQEIQRRVKTATHVRKLSRRSTTTETHRSLRERVVDPGPIALPLERGDESARSRT